MEKAAAEAPSGAVKAVRRFNRFFTRRIGVLAPYLGSELSLTDVRVLYELAHRDALVASDLARELGLDGGYLSRILRRFEGAGWISRTPSAKDARQSELTLTPAGHAAFAPLQQRSRDEAAALLSPLPAPRQAELVQAMNHYNGDQQVQLANMQRDIEAYDRQCHLYNSPFVTDDQLRRIQLLRRWRGDKARTLAGQAILDKNAGPLIAIKSRLISRKSMGGFCTDLSSRVFNRDGQIIAGLYAAGEAAGFGGGGIAGKRSLEGTFLSACILSARRAAQHIVQQA